MREFEACGGICRANETSLRRLKYGRAGDRLRARAAQNDRPISRATQPSSPKRIAPRETDPRRGAVIGMEEGASLRTVLIGGSLSCKGFRAVGKAVPRSVLRTVGGAGYPAWYCLDAALLWARCGGRNAAGGALRGNIIMRAILIVGLASVAFASSAFAQTNRGHPHDDVRAADAERRLHREHAGARDDICQSKRERRLHCLASEHGRCVGSVVFSGLGGASRRGHFSGGFALLVAMHSHNRPGRPSGA